MDSPEYSGSFRSGYGVAVPSVAVFWGDMEPIRIANHGVQTYEADWSMIHWTGPDWSGMLQFGPDWSKMLRIWSRLVRDASDVEWIETEFCSGHDALQCMAIINGTLIDEASEQLYTIIVKYWITH